MATTLTHSISAMSSSDSVTSKTHPWNQTACHYYHTTTVIAHTASYSKLRPIIGCRGNVPQHFSTPHLTHDSHGPSEPRNQTESGSVRSFLHRWPQSVPILYNGTPLSPSKLPQTMGSGPSSNTWFPGLTQVLIPNGISIGAAVFAGFTSVTDRQTTLLGR